VLRSVADESGAGCADRGDQPNRLCRAAETNEAAALAMAVSQLAVTSAVELSPTSSACIPERSAVARN
jgi:hypothetical protein